MTFQENIVEKYMTRAMREWDANPLAMSFLRRLANEAPAVFFTTAMKHLRSSEVSNAHRFIAILALRQEELMTYLANPANGSRDTAVKLFNRFLEVDPSFDVKLARKLPDRSYTNHTEAFDGSHTTRALDILDATSRGRRLLPILGHLPNSTDPRVAAKATLFVGRRVMSPAWSVRVMSSADQRVRANAIEAIWGLDTHPAVQLLEKCTEDKNNRVMGNALVGLHIAGQRNIESELRSLSRANTPDRRSTAAWAMGKIAQGQWVDALTVMIKDEHPRVRGMALRSLLDIRRHEAAVSEMPTVLETNAGFAASASADQTPDNIGTSYDAFPQYRYLR